MAPTVIHISDQAKVGEYCTTSGFELAVASFILDKNLDPPKNIAGKQCLVETTYFNYESTKPLREANAYGQSAYFGWNMNSLWSQIYTSLSSPMLIPAMSERDISQAQCFSTGSRVVRIPDGPFPVRFVCRQQNLNRRLTDQYYSEKPTWVALGANPYAAVDIVAGTSDTLILSYNNVTDVITIPPGTQTDNYATIGAMYRVLNPLMPPGYTLRTDGNTGNTRFVILRTQEDGIGSFSISGTARTVLGFGTGASKVQDYTILTAILHITPIE